MTFTETSLPGAYLVAPTVFQDERGWLVRTYCENEFASIGFTGTWVQMNHSMTRRQGSIRGMHYQKSPHAEVKLVRCLAGRVFDVIVDLRAGSPTLGQWFGAELSAVNRLALLIPKGFAHGFQTLTDDCELMYCHSHVYTPGSEGAVRFDDPRVGIDWPLSLADLSARDASHPLWDVSFTGLTV